MPKLRLGTMVALTGDPSEGIRKAASLGMRTCQVYNSDPAMYTDEAARMLKQQMEETGVDVSSMWTGWPGPSVWNFVEGPGTIGIVPPEYQRMRVDALKAGATFAKAVGCSITITHAGFIPENPTDPLYVGTVDALTEVAKHCLDLGITFCCETGQETPITLLRVIKDVGTGNVGVNLDPANLLMYGKANPVDALDILGPYIKAVHAKDGEYPTEPISLGHEKPLGEGRVNFPALIPKLKSFGFDGVLTIEREISGEQQIADIRRAMQILEPLL